MELDYLLMLNSVTGVIIYHEFVEIIYTDTVMQG